MAIDVWYTHGYLSTPLHTRTPVHTHQQTNHVGVIYTAGEFILLLISHVPNRREKYRQRYLDIERYAIILIYSYNGGV